MKSSFIVVAVVLASLSQSFAFASDTSLSSMPLAQAVAGNGSLLVLKGETIPGHTSSGFPTFQQYEQYNGAYSTFDVGSDPDKAGLGDFTCMATYETVDANYQPGDVTITANTSIPWLRGEFGANRLNTFTDTDGIAHQALRLSFNDSKLTQMLCTIVGNGALQTLTIKDFENAMGGRMTLVPAAQNQSQN